LRNISRRTFLTGLGVAAISNRSAVAQNRSTRLILLGTGGGPRPAIDRLVARVPNAEALKTSILAHQTSAEDAGRVAQEAGVKTLVLSHFVPPDDPEVTDAMWLEAARRHFRGTRHRRAGSPRSVTEDD